ncbi:nucleotide-diphospho-sugar transferase [Aspergillus indologenus CBS 114.80]|uniref:Nucleotide-diphospho-sugar transferase n=1 Tax=Aspergillus indologenus CBS 114.80 TaxID=1450541 RepID=A0A2V5HQU0_9EURO|nr:nucleotide-diphospho-sugar transferase [Aspergillus indologenus CBS 114.80]
MVPSGSFFSSQRFRKHIHPIITRAAKYSFHLYCFTRIVALVLDGGYTTWRMWLLLLAEYMIASRSTTVQELTLQASRDSAGCSSSRQRLGLKKNASVKELPRVDIFIPCCGEDEEIILDTVRAACLQDYPQDRLRVVVLDDGNSPSLQQAIVSRLCPRWPHLSYRTRRGKKSLDRHQRFQKADNLNYGLFSLNTEGEAPQPAEFFAVFDADCMPMRQFLRATLPHLLRDRNVALATTNQFYYNLPPGDPLYQAVDSYQSVYFPLLAACGILIANGTGSLYRRESIVGIGGFPTVSLGEDLMLSNILRSQGASAVLLPEILQVGRIPTSLEGHVCQRQRWALGEIQQIRVLRYSWRDTSNSPFGNQQLRQRVAWQGILSLWNLICQAVGFAIVPAVLAGGGGHALIPLAVWRPWFRIQYIMAVSWVALSWLDEWCHAARTGFKASIFTHLEDSWIAPAQLWFVLQRCIQTPDPKRSLVTGNKQNPWNDHGRTNKNKNNNSANSKSRRMRMRLGGFLPQPIVLYNSALLAATLATMAYSGYAAWGLTSPPGHTGDLPTTTATATDGRTMTLETATMRLLTGLGWPPVVHLCYLVITSSWVPVSAAWCPPIYPDRETALTYDSGLGAHYPTDEVLRGLETRQKPAWGLRRHFFLLPVALVVYLFLLPAC